MKITLTNCRYTPRWTSLETIIQESISDAHAKLIKIRRVDNGCNYRAPGEYNLEIQRGDASTFPVKLIVKEQS